MPDYEFSLTRILPYKDRKTEVDHPFSTCPKLSENILFHTL